MLEIYGKEGVPSETRTETAREGRFVPYYETLSRVYPECYRTCGHSGSRANNSLTLRQSQTCSYESFGAGGGSSRAVTVSVKFSRLCAPSQNGLFIECPQRHRLTIFRPPSPKALPSGSTISKSPSTRREPLFKTVSFVAAKTTSVICSENRNCFVQDS